MLNELINTFCRHNSVVQSNAKERTDSSTCIRSQQHNYLELCVTVQCAYILFTKKTNIYATNLFLETHYTNVKQLFNFRLGLLVDFLVVIVPLQLMLTVLSGYIPFCLFLLTLLIWIVFNKRLRQDGAKEIKKSLIIGEITMGSKRPYITYYRAFMNLVTAISILAVDFRIFPRYFGKTETYGTGLMDMGVGGFLISNAIVSPEARGVITNERQIHLQFSQSAFQMCCIIVEILHDFLHYTDYQNIPCFSIKYILRSDKKQDILVVNCEQKCGQI